VEQLNEETGLIANGGYGNIHVQAKNKYMPQQLAYNCFPHIGSFVEGDYTNEEWKLVNETHKIMHAPKIKVSATTVRVAVRTGHSESVYIETVKPVTPQQARQVLTKAPGVVLMDEPKNNLYPMPKDVEGRDETFVGRIRQDAFNKKGLWLWVVADNLRKGAATNAVQIAECVISSSK
jgi:aspartate-semialdehyde dehydrogenase